MDIKNQCGCHDCDCRSKTNEESGFKSLTVSWQRLIEGGGTCPRCGSTEEELEKAILQLRNALSPLGLEVLFEKREMALEEFKKDPAKSNRILLNGRSLEELIGAKTGQNQCCDVCGDEECRTVEIGGETLEAVPAALIVKAGLKAAADLIG